MRRQITCPTCKHSYYGRVLHAGFDDSEFLYCDRCFRIALLSIYSRSADILLRLAVPALWSWRESAASRIEIEASLRGCECGGRFTFDAVPKCFNCQSVLPLETILEAFGAHGWWGVGWRGFYCLIQEEHLVQNPYS